MRIAIQTATFCLITAGLMLAAPVMAGSAKDGKALTTLLHEFMAGASINSAAAHDRFWAEQLVYTSSNGTRFGKADIMEGLASADTEQDSADADPALVYTAEDIQIQQYGKTAVVAFQLVGTPADGSQVLNYFNTGTFVNGAEGWQAVAWQATRIPVEEKSAD